VGGTGAGGGPRANAVVLGFPARHGHPISFWRFTKYGSVVAVVTIAVSWAYLWLRYYAFA